MFFFWNNVHAPPTPLENNEKEHGLCNLLVATRRSLLISQPAAMTEGSENSCSEQYQKSYLLLMESITNNQTDQYSPGNRLPNYHKLHFSI